MIRAALPEECVVFTSLVNRDAVRARKQVERNVANRRAIRIRHFDGDIVLAVSIEYVMLFPVEVEAGWSFAGAQMTGRSVREFMISG